MTISWLTCTDNAGGLVLSMNQNRYTAQILAACEHFVLSVPTQGMEQMVLAVGGCHGSEEPGDCTETDCTGKVGDKISHLGLKICVPGWRRQGHELAHGLPKGSKKARQYEKIREVETMLDLENLLAVEDAVAHIVCKLKSVEGSIPGHNLLLCQMVCGYVRPAYWSGNIFCPQCEGVPPYLTFFGSQTFGYVSGPS